MLFSQDFLYRSVSAPLSCCLLLGIFGCGASAATLSNNLNQVTDFTEIVSGPNWITAGFGTGNSNSTLTDAVLLLQSDSGSGDLSLELFSDQNGQPSAPLGRLISPTSFSPALSQITFGGAGLSLEANTTYWLVAQALTGQFEWAFTDSNGGSGIGFQHLWGSSENSGADWFTSDLEPMQMRVDASTVTSAPEPGTLALLSLALLAVLNPLLRRKSKGSGE
jgi:hypothetical protein